MSKLKAMKTWFKLPVCCMPSDIGGWMEHVNFGVKGLSSHHCEAIEDAINNHDRLVEDNQRLTADMNNAISLMSPSWQHAATKEPGLMTRYVKMAENQFKKKNEEIERLTAIATKQATRADELYETLETVLLVLEGKTEFNPDEISTEGVREVLEKSRIEAEQDDA